jgi:hypothetical protein
MFIYLFTYTLIIHNLTTLSVAYAILHRMIKGLTNKNWQAYERKWSLPNLIHPRILLGRQTSNVSGLCKSENA